MTIFLKLLSLYTWLGIAFLLFLLYQIAHFYQMTTGLRSHYRLFFVPMGFFIAAMARYLMVERGFTGDVLGDFCFSLGGISLILMGYSLLKLMTGGR
ncbi:MAG: hypothetical protein PVF45_01725 [Anaerolineae bacterium]|jgi:hypothetical protein